MRQEGKVRDLLAPNCHEKVLLPFRAALSGLRTLIKEIPSGYVCLLIIDLIQIQSRQLKLTIIEPSYEYFTNPFQASFLYIMSPWVEHCAF